MATDTIENPDVLIAGELFKEPTSFQRDGSHPVTFRAMRHKSVMLGSSTIVSFIVLSLHNGAPLVQVPPNRQRI